ncbi:hypothetical protein D3C71_1822530 [compost metagenome]
MSRLIAPANSKVLMELIVQDHHPQSLIKTIALYKAYSNLFWHFHPSIFDGATYFFGKGSEHSYSVF